MLKNTYNYTIYFDMYSFIYTFAKKKNDYEKLSNLGRS